MMMYDPQWVEKKREFVLFFFQTKNPKHIFSLKNPIFFGWPATPVITGQDTKIKFPPNSTGTEEAHHRPRQEYANLAHQHRQQHMISVNGYCSLAVDSRVGGKLDSLGRLMTAISQFSNIFFLHLNRFISTKIVHSLPNHFQVVNHSAN